MRTNIDIDEKKLKEVMAFMGTKTKKETVETLINEKLWIKRQQGTKKLFGKIDGNWDLDAWRRD